MPGTTQIRKMTISAKKENSGLARLTTCSNHRTFKARPMSSFFDSQATGLSGYPGLALVNPKGISRVVPPSHKLAYLPL